MLQVRYSIGMSAVTTGVSAREGFGTTLEKTAMQGLKAVIRRDWRSDRLSLVLEIPLESLVT